MVKPSKATIRLINMISSDVIILMKQELGRLLKETREQKGLSSQQVAEMTKINIRYIEGIERGDWSVMPGDFYARGFLRTYAKAINLDITDYLKEFDRQEEKEKQAKSQKGISDNDIIKSPVAPVALDSVKSIRFGKIFATSLVLVLLIVFSYSVYNYVSNLEREPVEPTIEQPVTDNVVNELPAKEENDEDEERPTEATSVTKTATDGTDDYFEISDVTSYRLIITATRQNCWYEVRAGNSNGAIVSTSTLRVGDAPVQLELTENVWIRLGNPAGVELFINDELLDIEDLNQPRNVHINLAN